MAKIVVLLGSTGARNHAMLMRARSPIAIKK